MKRERALSKVYIDNVWTGSRTEYWVYYPDGILACTFRENAIRLAQFESLAHNLSAYGAKRMET